MGSRNGGARTPVAAQSVHRAWVPRRCWRTNAWSLSSRFLSCPISPWVKPASTASSVSSSDQPGIELVCDVP